MKLSCLKGENNMDMIAEILQTDKAAAGKLEKADMESGELLERTVKEAQELKENALKEAEAYAAKIGKPLFIDFTGHGCVNCREMEARVWADPQVLDILRNDYVIVALYSDDKKVLPESDWVTTDAGKVLKSLGKINSYYALKTYGVNAQPYYVLQGRNGKQLVPPRGYDLNVDNFVGFLKSGVEAYNAQK